MKLCLLLISIVLYGCNNDIPINDYVDSQPVVYSLLNVNDTCYTVSLTKTFIGDSNAFILAKEPDFLFYNIPIIKLSALNKELAVWETDFTKINVGKIPGIFSEIPGSIFHSTSVITDFDENGFLSGNFRDVEAFRLTIQLGGGETPIISTIPVFLPNTFISPDKPVRIGLFNPDLYEVHIRPSTETSFCQLNCNIRYLEKDVGRDSLVEIEKSIVLRKNVPIVDKKIIATIPPDFFLNKLASNIPDVRDLQYRKFVDFDLVLYSADENFQNYIDTYVYTTDFGKPAWSNIENGIGFFSLVYMKILEGMTFDQRTKDSIALSPITRELKFSIWQ